MNPDKIRDLVVNIIATVLDKKEDEVRHNIGVVVGHQPLRRSANVTLEYRVADYDTKVDEVIVRHHRSVRRVFSFGDADFSLSENEFVAKHLQSEVRTLAAGISKESEVWKSGSEPQPA